LLTEAPAPADRDVGGASVILLDVSPAKEAGTQWPLADHMRESAPAYFNTFAQGYRIFTRHEAVCEI
jgi:hypothetical protein